MAIDKIQSESINLADNFAFTGTVTGAGENNTPLFRSHQNSALKSDIRDINILMKDLIIWLAYGLLADFIVLKRLRASKIFF